MPDVTLNEAKAARDACGQAIKAAVALFIRQTGLEVASVDLTRLESSTGEPAVPIVTLTVELP